jgi:hypothetical protein
MELGQLGGEGLVLGMLRQIQERPELLGSCGSALSSFARPIERRKQCSRSGFHDDKVTVAAPA